MIIEEIVRNYLENTLSVPATMERKEDYDGKYVMIERTGGGETNHIKSARVAVQSYAPSMHEAAELNEEVKNAMKGFVQLQSVTAANIDTDYNFTDESRGEYRYQAVFLISHY